jgi:hypothetical protein
MAQYIERIPDGLATRDSNGAERAGGKFFSPDPSKKKL